MTRDIGLGVAEPPREPAEGDMKNPFNGTLPIRGRLFEGTVISASARNTVVVERDAPAYIPKFKRYARSRRRIHAHVPSNIDAGVGARVMAAECRPVSKSVSFVVVEAKA